MLNIINSHENSYWMHLMTNRKHFTIHFGASTVTPKGPQFLSAVQVYQGAPCRFPHRTPPYKQLCWGESTCFLSNTALNWSWQQDKNIAEHLSFVSKEVKPHSVGWWMAASSSLGCPGSAGGSATAGRPHICLEVAPGSRSRTHSQPELQSLR